MNNDLDANIRNNLPKMQNEFLQEVEKRDEEQHMRKEFLDHALPEVQKEFMEKKHMLEEEHKSREELKHKLPAIQNEFMERREQLEEEHKAQKEMKQHVQEVQHELLKKVHKQDAVELKVKKEESAELPKEERGMFSTVGEMVSNAYHGVVDTVVRMVHE
jgi:chromosome segregation ATPase